MPLARKKKAASTVTVDLPGCGRGGVSGGLRVENWVPVQFCTFSCERPRRAKPAKGGNGACEFRMQVDRWSEWCVAVLVASGSWLWLLAKLIPQAE